MGQFSERINTRATLGKNLEDYDNYAVYILGTTDEVINVLTKQLEISKNNERSVYFPLSTNPFYDPYRSDPRFQEILAKYKELYEENLRKYGDIDL